MSLSRLWLFLAVALPVLASLLAGLSSVDLAYHLRAGAETLDTASIPSVDTWTFTAAGLPWANQQWGAQVVLELVERMGGWSVLAVFRALLVGWIFGCLLVICRRRGLDARTASMLTLAAFFVTAVALTLRPQLLGMACFAPILVLLADRHRRPRRLWLIPVITLVWANLHGSFFLAPLVVGLTWLEDVHDRVPQARMTLAVAIVSALAACVTPSGPGVWVYAIGLSVNPLVTSRITEWQPTSLRDIPGILFFASALGVVALLSRRERPTPWPTLAWLAVFFLIGVYAVRGQAWWPIAAAFAVAGLVGPTAEARLARAEPPTMRRLNAVVAGLIVVVSVVLLPFWRPVDPDLGTPAGLVAHAPPGITGTLHDLVAPGDRIFHPQPWGSWFEFTFPDQLVVIDSRIELFPPEVWDQYEAVVAGIDGWQDQLAAWDVDIVVVAATDPGFHARLAAAGWITKHADDDGWVMERAET